jgi:DNA-binding SARP family transcriptional activator
LAQLLVNANQTVSAPRLIDGIWGDDSVQHPESALHVVVSRLRRVLGSVAARLVSDTSGYRIELAPNELDLGRAHAHADRAQQALRVGDPARAATSFDAALACWTGEPLADVTGFPFHEPAVRVLRQFRLGIVESRNAAYLRCGRHLDVLADIEAWIENEPWRERLRAHQMVALYRSDRQIEALGVYEDLRHLLVDDFGVEPHADLQRLHGRILRRDPGLLANRGPNGVPNGVPINDAGEEELVERLRELRSERKRRERADA